MLQHLIYIKYEESFPSRLYEAKEEDGKYRLLLSAVTSTPPPWYHRFPTHAKWLKGRKDTLLRAFAAFGTGMLGLEWPFVVAQMLEGMGKMQSQ